MTKEQIIEAINKGKQVYWASLNYPVIKFSTGYYITCVINTHSIPLFDKNGKLNELENSFFVAEES